MSDETVRRVFDLLTAAMGCHPADLGERMAQTEYAQEMVKVAQAPLLAEVEALRAERDRLRELARRAEVVLGLFIDCESEGGIRRDLRAATRDHK